MNKADLLEKAKNLGIDNVTEDNTVKEIKAAIADVDQESQDNPQEKQEDQAEIIFKDDRGLEWTFKKSAPKTINIDGKIMTQQEIADQEDIMLELVYGNSNFLTQKL